YTLFVEPSITNYEMYNSKDFNVIFVSCQFTAVIFRLELTTEILFYMRLKSSNIKYSSNGSFRSYYSTVFVQFPPKIGENLTKSQLFYSGIKNP
ncbi:hypothetical protein L9F63_002554, partial [Diploptera punctata]